MKVVEKTLREKFRIPDSYTVVEIEGWWSTVKADIRIWVCYDEHDREIVRYKMEQFIGDVPLWSVVDKSWS